VEKVWYNKMDEESISPPARLSSNKIEPNGTGGQRISWGRSYTIVLPSGTNETLRVLVW